jgi:hypothetical protein
MVKRISKETERNLIDALDEVRDRVADGATPTDAVAKVAADRDCPAGHVQLMVQAYNTMQSNLQRQRGSTPSEKSAHFELADATQVLDRLFPDPVNSAKQASAISDDYRRPPARPLPSYADGSAVHVKQASSVPRDTARLSKRAFDLVADLRQEHERQRREANGCLRKVAAAYGELVDYFQQHYRESFGTVRERSLTYFGPTAGPIFDKLAEERSTWSREAPSRQAAPLEPDQAPYSLVAECLAKTAAHREAQDAFEAFAIQAGEANATLMREILPAGSTKRAFGLDTIGDISAGMQHAVGGKAVDSLLGTMVPKHEDTLKGKALSSLLSPDHDAKLRQIRSQAVFHDLMHNDELLSGHDPEHLAQIYNEIGKVSPRSMDQPLLMRSLLRRYVSQGQVDPHDVDQLAGIESRLKEREQPVNAPNMPGKGD